MKVLNALIVGPDEAARRYVAELLEPCGFDCVGAADGIGALYHASPDGIDLIVSDSRLSSHQHEVLLEFISRGAFGLNPPPHIVCHDAQQSRGSAASEGVTRIAAPFTPRAFSQALDLAFPAD